MNRSPSPLKELPKSVLMVCDQFIIGGRETFLQDVVYLMRKVCVENISLIAEHIDNPSADGIFNTTVCIGKDKGIDSWLELGDALIKQTSPEFIWAHHYSLVPALLLAERHKLPLHITIHGPLLSAGRFMFHDALAFSLASSSGASVSGVSDEIMQQLKPFNDQINRWGVFPNKVRLEGKLSEPTPLAKTPGKALKSIRFAAFSRQSKFEHLRQAVVFAYRFKRLGYSVEIDIYTGITVDQGIASTQLKRYQKLGRLFGRKWFFKRPFLIPFMKHIQLHPLTDNVTNAMQQCDVVLGMGRVSLEAIGNSKTSVLIGYDRVIGVIDVGSFKQYQTTNFSGRSQKPLAVKKVIKDTLKALTNDQQALDELAALAGIENSRPDLESLLIHASNGNAIRFRSNDVEQLLVKESKTRDYNDFCGSSVLNKHEKALLTLLTGAGRQSV